MAKLYLSSDYAIYPEGNSLTEQEHTDSCDINKMVKNAARGLQVRGGPQPQFGYDDTTLTGLDVRIQKQQLEESLHKISSENEFSPEELQHIPNDVKSKFKFKTKKAEQKPVPNANDITNANQDVTQPPKNEGSPNPPNSISPTPKS